MTVPAGGGAPDPVDLEGLINPIHFVCRSMHLDTKQIHSGADALRTMGRDVRDQVSGIRMSWSRLPASYEGPEQEQVYTLMDDPRDAAEDMKKRLFSAATHLDTYADIIQGISLDLLTLEEEAWEFRAEAQAGYEEAKPKSGSPNAPSFGTEMKEVAWWEHSPARQRNEELLGRHAVLIEKVSNAATYCANRINELQMGTLEESYTPVTADQILNSSEPMPWGNPDPEPKNCGQSVASGAGTWAKDTWYGATSFFGFDGDETTPRGETAKQAWLGTVDFVSAASVAISPVSYLAYVPGISDTEPAQVIKDRHRTARDGVGAMVGWDGAEAAAGGDGWHQWKDDPVAMGTQVGIDAVLIAVPIGGWAAGAGKAGIKGSRAAGATGRGGKTTRVAGGALDFLVPGGGRLVEGASTVFSKRLSASGSRTNVLDEVDLTETAPPAAPRDRTATDDSSPTGADGDTTPLREDRTGESSTTANDERAASKDSTDDSTTTEFDRTDGSRETVREHAPADTPSAKESAEPETTTMTERERGEARAQEAAAAIAEERRRPGTAATTYRPSTYEGPSGRETKAYKGIMSRPTPGEAQAALDRAPQNEHGQPVDHRNGKPLLLEDLKGRRGWAMRWDPDAGEWVAENRTLKDHGMAAKGEPNTYGYDANGDLLPYANHRPSYSPNQVEDVWKRSRKALDIQMKPGGALQDLPPLRHENEMWVRVRDDARTEGLVDLGKDRGKWRRIEWHPGDSRTGVWDMGHVQGAKYSDLHDRYMRGDITTEQFLKRYHRVRNYSVEDPGRNRSHVDE